MDERKTTSSSPPPSPPTTPCSPSRDRMLSRIRSAGLHVDVNSLSSMSRPSSLAGGSLDHTSLTPTSCCSDAGNNSLHSWLDGGAADPDDGDGGVGIGDTYGVDGGLERTLDFSSLVHEGAGEGDEDRGEATAAATRIQRWWSRLDRGLPWGVTGGCAAWWGDLRWFHGIVDWASQTTSTRFGSIVASLQSSNVLERTKAVLRGLPKSRRSRRYPPSIRSTRSFLSALVIGELLYPVE